MNPNLYSPPLSDTTVDDITNRDGLLETMPLLDLKLPDSHIIQNLHTRIQMSLDYWNDTQSFNLRNKRIKNLRMVRGDQLNEHQLYHYQTPWKDNELFVGLDAMIAYATASIAEVEVYPASKKPESKSLATDLKTYMKCHSRKFELDKELEAVAFNLFTQYVGVLKLEWNGLYGKYGEIIPRSVNPMNLIIDKNARRGQTPAFICEVLKASVEELIAKFPKKEKEILALYSIQRKGSQNMTKELAYREVHFIYYEKNKPCLGVAWYLQNLVLDKRKDPNWLYGDEGDNFLDNPAMPYIPFNLFTDGEHWIDFTSSVEQAVPVQDILNKEGRQIIDNLATANGFRVVLAGAMTDDALENLTGDPNQSVVVKVKPSQKIDDVFKQIQPQMVSQQLIADKQDTRNTIHGILGTPSQFRGDDTDQTKTASEAALIKNQASGRQDKVVRALNAGLDRYYPFLAQMILVWYTEKHKLTADGGDGNFDFLEMHRDNIEPGMTIRVYAKPSSDKAREEAVTQNAADVGFLAPIDYYKGMHMDDPQKLYDNLVKWKTSPQQLAMDVKNDEEDKDALQDFAMLMGGQKPAQRDDITPEYLEQFRKKMISDDFLKAKQTIKQKVITFVQQSAQSLAMRDELNEASNEPLPPPPLPPEVQQTLPPPPPPALSMPMTGGVPMPPAQPMVDVPQMTPPPLGIQSVMQNAQQLSPPNLNPNAQPQGAVDITQLTPR